MLKGAVFIGLCFVYVDLFNFSLTKKLLRPFSHNQNQLGRWIKSVETHTLSIMSVCTFHCCPSSCCDYKQQSKQTHS